MSLGRLGPQELRGSRLPIVHLTRLGVDHAAQQGLLNGAGMCPQVCGSLGHAVERTPRTCYTVACAVVVNCCLLAQVVDACVLVPLISIGRLARLAHLRVLSSFGMLGWVGPIGLLILSDGQFGFLLPLGSIGSLSLFPSFASLDSRCSSA